MRDTMTRFRGGVTAKVLWIGLLGLAMLVPMAFVEGLILERSARLDAARADVATGWGGAQTLGAPILVLPFTYLERVGDEMRRVRDELHVLPRSLSVKATVAPDTLRRGLYEVPVYTADIALRGTLPPPRFERAYDGLELLWDEAEITLPLTDPRPLSAPLRLRLADGEAEFEAAGRTGCPRVAAIAGTLNGMRPEGSLPGTAVPRVMYGGGLGGLATGARIVGPCDAAEARLSVAFPALGLAPLTTTQSFALDVTLRGTHQLHFLPLGDTTEVEVNSSWPSPSFGGTFLPIARQVAREGFSARWSVLSLGRGYPSSFTASSGLASSLPATSFGVALLPPQGLHESSLRAAKYAVLFIALTFLAYFLFEVFGTQRLHSLHYLSVGAANCTFFLLLLAVGEHIGFAGAYMLSAGAATALIAVYSAAVLGSRRRGLAIAAMLGAIYAYLYVTLKAEDFALLIGALGVFAVLAAFMLMTRRIDWHAIGGAHDAERGTP